MPRASTLSGKLKKHIAAPFPEWRVPLMQALRRQVKRGTMYRKHLWWAMNMAVRRFMADDAPPWDYVSTNYLWEVPQFVLSVDHSLYPPPHPLQGFIQPEPHVRGFITDYVQHLVVATHGAQFAPRDPPATQVKAFIMEECVTAIKNAVWMQLRPLVVNALQAELEAVHDGGLLQAAQHAAPPHDSLRALAMAFTRNMLYGEAAPQPDYLGAVEMGWATAVAHAYQALLPPLQQVVDGVQVQYPNHEEAAKVHTWLYMPLRLHCARFLDEHLPASGVSMLPCPGGGKPNFVRVSAVGLWEILREEQNAGMFAPWDAAEHLMCCHVPDVVA
jgi:hypothetical protein